MLCRCDRTDALSSARNQSRKVCAEHRFKSHDRCGGGKTGTADPPHRENRSDPREIPPAPTLGQVCLFEGAGASSVRTQYVDRQIAALQVLDNYEDLPRISDGSSFIYPFAGSTPSRSAGRGLDASVLPQSLHPAHRTPGSVERYPSRLIESQITRSSGSNRRAAAHRILNSSNLTLFF